MNKAGIAVLLLVGIVAVKAQTPPGPITTSLGLIDGTLCSGVLAKEYLGIRFAKPPVGALRWAQPVLYNTPWTGIYEATSYGPECPQFTSGTTTIPANTDEDCLFLNVWVPYGIDATGLPVRVFIYGGSFNSGSASVSAYNGCAAAARTSSILVAMNYRVAQFGFFSTADIQASANGKAFGNWGLMDQRLALQWVQNNIAAFGGDPTKVLLHGQSAGSISAFLQLLISASAGLYRSVLCESGTLVVAQSAATANANGNSLVHALNCNGSSLATNGFDSATDCLRNQSWQSILHAVSAGSAVSLLWEPIVDGVDLPLQPAELLLSGHLNEVDSLTIGSNLNEGNYFAWTGYGPYFGLNVPSTYFNSTVQSSGNSPYYYNIIAQQYALQYFPSSTSVFDSIGQMLGDQDFRCGGEIALQYISAYYSAKIPKLYHYIFTHVPEYCNLYASIGVPNSIYTQLGSIHTAELVFVFDQENSTVGCGNMGADEVALARAITNAWTSLAETGTPGPNWPQWTVTNKQTAIWEVNNNLPSIVNLDYTCVCNVWAEQLLSPTSVPAGTAPCPVVYDSLPIVTVPTPTPTPTATVYTGAALIADGPLTANTASSSKNCRYDVDGILGTGFSASVNVYSETTTVCCMKLGILSGSSCTPTCSATSTSDYIAISESICAPSSLCIELGDYDTAAQAIQIYTGAILTGSGLYDFTEASSTKDLFVFRSANNYAAAYTVMTSSSSTSYACILKGVYDGVHCQVVTQCKGSPTPITPFISSSNNNDDDCYANCYSQE